MSTRINSPVSITLRSKIRLAKWILWTPPARNSLSASKVQIESETRWPFKITRYRGPTRSWTKERIETKKGERTNGMKLNGNFDGGVSSNRQKEDKRMNKRDFHGSDFGLPKNHCSVTDGGKWRASGHFETRDPVYTAKKQFSFPDNAQQIGVQATTGSVADATLASTKQFQFNLRERTNDRIRGRDLHRSTEIAPGRAKSVTKLGPSRC